MGTSTVRILALGGGLRFNHYKQQPTAHYLPRVLLIALSVALSLSTLTSLLFKAQQQDNLPMIGPRPIKGIAMIEQYVMRDHTGGVQIAPKPRLARQRFIIPIPAPDAEVVEVSEQETLTSSSSSDVGTSWLDDGFTGVGDGTDGWTPTRPEPPTVFLFVEVPPELVSLVIPAYPELAREAGVEGAVFVEVLVSEEGFVLDATVMQSLPLLDEAALEAAYSAVFRPAQQSGRPVRTRVVMPVEFSLRH